MPTPFLADLGIHTFFFRWGTTRKITFKKCRHRSEIRSVTSAAETLPAAVAMAKLCQRGATPTLITPNVEEYIYITDSVVVEIGSSPK